MWCIWAVGGPTMPHPDGDWKNLEITSTYDHLLRTSKFPHCGIVKVLLLLRRNITTSRMQSVSLLQLLRSCVFVISFETNPLVYSWKTSLTLNILEAQSWHTVFPFSEFLFLLWVKHCLVSWHHSGKMFWVVFSTLCSSCQWQIIQHHYGLSFFFHISVTKKYGSRVITQ